MNASVRRRLLLAAACSLAPFGLFANLDLSAVAIWQDAPGFNVVGLPGTGDHFGRVVATGDWNGDGHDDVAVADRENLLAANAGAVHVLYSNFTGVSADDDYLTDFNPLTAADDVEAGDEFGADIVAGDFDGDGFDDLAIGIPLESAMVGPGSYVDCGAVLVLYGAATGLTEAGAIKLLPPFAGDLTSAHFGAALAAGDFDGDGFDDLAVGSPTADVAGFDQAGIVVIYDGAAAGLAAFSKLLFQGASDASGTLSGTAEANDRFGWALAAGNFNGDSNGAGGPAVSDLAIGAPGEGDPTAMTSGSGQVHILYGDPLAGGLTYATDQAFHQANTATGETIETGDAFGFTVAAGDVNGDGKDEIVAAAPHENVIFGMANVVDAGAVTVVFGAFPVVIVSGGAVSFDQGDFAIGENPETEDFFGWSLAVADVDGDGFAEIFVGTPYEDVVDPVTFATRVDAGAVTVVRGGPAVLPPAPSAPPRLVAQRIGGHTGTLDVGDLYGQAIAAGDFDGDGHADLAVGTPGELALDGAGDPIFDAGALYVLYGSLFSDGFETGNETYWSDVAP